MTARELAWRYTHPDADRVRPSPTCHRTYRSGSVRYAQEASGHHLHGWCRVLQGAPDPLATTRARTSNSLATSDTPAVAVTATSAQAGRPASAHTVTSKRRPAWALVRSEEHTSELQSHSDVVCRLMLEIKKIIALTHRSWLFFIDICW